MPVRPTAMPSQSIPSSCSRRSPPPGACGKRRDGRRSEAGRARLETIRALEAASGRPIGVMADLQGPKLRVGTFLGDATQLVRGQSFRLDLDEAPGDVTRAPLPH